MNQNLTWWDKNISEPKSYIRSYGEGVGTSSRNWLLDIIQDGESLLDVGCGPGCTYENLEVHHRKIRYRGLDYSLSFIKACEELFPEGDFRVGNANKLNEPNSSWDTVLLRHLIEHCPGYEAPIREALRVARKRVIIIMWRPLGDGPDKIQKLGDEGYCSDYNRKAFLDFLVSFEWPVESFEFPGNRPNWAWVIRKEPEGTYQHVDGEADTTSA